ncbi:MAG TPA: hypothetical protein VEL69_02430 [Ktedonobacteraceae bacterium]|nr:hypothetical protein [Ktedonobacteraceae bacterium]
MSNAPEQLSPDEISQLFAKLPPRDVAEFYASYQQWLRQQQLAQLQTRIVNVRQQIAANDLQMQQAHPSAIALASLARLQSNGVTDLDLLDRMLERGDTWLDNTIQHLEYCEKFDFIRGNYTQWCEHALEGAYDWIDSMRKVSLAANALPQSAVNSPDQTPSPSPAATPTNNTTDEALNEATEETFLQKLMSEEDISHLDIALTLEIISPVNPIPADTPIPLEDQDTAQIQATGPHAKQPLVETPDADAPFVASQPLDTPIVAGTPIEHRDPLDPTPVLVADTPVERRDPLDPTPVLVDEPPTGAIENIADSTLVHVEESLATPADAHNPAPPSAEELHTIEDSSETSLPESQVDAPAQTTSTPPLLEDITQPLIPTQARQKEVSDIPTFPEIPTMATPQSQQESAQQATQLPLAVAQPPKKRNFLQRLFSRR